MSRFIGRVIIVMMLLFLMTDQAVAKTQIQFWYGLKGYLGKQVEKVCARFNASQSEFELTCANKGNYDQVLQAGIAAYRAKKHPHILQGVERATGTLMLSGAVYPAYQLMADHGYEVDWGDYIEGVSHYYASSDGKLYSFPFNSSTPVTYINLDMYAKAGVERPAKTWEEFEDILRKLKAAGIACPIAFSTYLWVHLEQFSAMHDQPIATRGNGYEGLDAELVFNKGLYVDHVKRLKRWLDEGLGSPAQAAFGIGTRESFAQGKCGHYFGSIASHGTVTRDAKMQWSVAPVPHNAGVNPRNTMVGGSSLWTLLGHPKEDYKAVGAFFDFLRANESQEFWSTVTGYIPVTTSAYNYLVSKGFYQDAPYKGREVAIESLQRTKPGLHSRGIRLGNWVQARAALQEELDKAMAGEKSVQQALDDAVRRGNLLLRRFEKQYKGKSLP